MVPIIPRSRHRAPVLKLQASNPVPYRPADSARAKTLYFFRQPLSQNAALLHMC